MAQTRRRKVTPPEAPEVEAPARGSKEGVEPTRPQRILSWEVNNILGIRSAFIDAQGKHVVMIGGKNKQGKTSACKALQMALSGKKVFPVSPVRNGESYGTVEVKLSDLTVHLTVTHHEPTLRITDADGAPIKKTPQTLLKRLFAERSFDPLKFITQDTTEQDNDLKDLCGVKEAYDALEALAAIEYAERTEINREVKHYTERLKGLPFHQDVPEKESSSSDVLAEIERMEATKRANDQVRDRVKSAAADVERAATAKTDAEAAIRDTEDDIKELVARLEAKHAVLDAKRVALKKAIESEAQAVKRRVEAIAATEALEDPDVKAKKAELGSLEEINLKVRQNAERRKVERLLKETEEASRAKTQRLNEIDDEKLDLIGKAKMPVPGLGFSLAPPYIGVTYDSGNGPVPLSQIADSEKVRLSCAIGFAMNPDLKLLVVKDAAFLDEEGIRLMDELAEENDALIILERVGTTDESAVIIEDGTVVREPVAAE